MQRQSYSALLISKTGATGAPLTKGANISDSSILENHVFLSEVGRATIALSLYM